MTDPRARAEALLNLIEELQARFGNARIKPRVDAARVQEVIRALLGEVERLTTAATHTELQQRLMTFYGVTTPQGLTYMQDRQIERLQEELRKWKPEPPVIYGSPRR